MQVLWAGYLSSLLTISIKALQGIQSINRNLVASSHPFFNHNWTWETLESCSKESYSSLVWRRRWTWWCYWLFGINGGYSKVDECDISRIWVCEQSGWCWVRSCVQTLLWTRSSFWWDNVLGSSWFVHCEINLLDRQQNLTAFKKEDIFLLQLLL